MQEASSPTKIAVGSRNPAKLEAVRQAILPLWPQAQIEGVAVPSGVPAMPMSDGQCLAGARNRAREALRRMDAELGVGLEGGVNHDEAGLMLVGWVAVIDALGREGIGGTARLPLPASIARRVLSGEELGPVMDDLLDETKSNYGGGAVGALTDGLVLRAEAFAMAVTYALSPFVASQFHDFLP